MNTSLSWIREYVPELSVTPQEYADAMTLSGSKVEEYKCLDEDLDKILIGRIDKIEKHPDADKLIVCQVDVGKADIVQIVTGAPNVQEGDKVPVVLEGGRVAGDHDGKMSPGGIKIKRGKLRGIESKGMLCSIEELGSSKDMYPEAPENGIYIFSADAPVGESAVKALGLDDVIFEYEITSNRVDCFGVLGIAREAAATFGKEFKPPVVKASGNGEDVNDYIKISVKDSELCKRYCARVVKNINIAPSPQWMQRYLRGQGIRPINNVVDITNFVMEEYGQPMHAYDLDTIAGREIIVRRAAKGEKFITLDGQERKLDDSVLMICDGEKAVGIAGIMGGENSMITDQAVTLLFEAACFDGTNIRLSSKKVGLRTDASGKFEKGLDPNNAIAAINRACQLIEEIGAGEVIGGAVDIYGGRVTGREIPFDSQRINKLLGTALSDEEMIAYLGKVELRYNQAKNVIEVPSWRPDILCPADIAEEVARFYGYDRIESSLPAGGAVTGKLSDKLRIEAIVRSTAEFCGFSQGMAFSFESPKVFDKLLLPENSKLREAVVIANPLGEDFSIMRTVSVNGILNSLATNFNHRNKDVRLYELGNIYRPKQLPVTELPEERMQLTLGMYGEGDFYTMKGVVEEIFGQLGMFKKAAYDASANIPYLHPGRQANISYENERMGYMGEVHPQTADHYGIKERVCLAVLDLPKLTAKADFGRKYQGIPKYPAVSRDISLVVPKSITAGEIESIFDENRRRAGQEGAYLENYDLFDLYEGVQIKKGYKSLAYSILFRAQDKTLEDAEVAVVMKKIIKALEEKGIELRQ